MTKELSASKTLGKRTNSKDNTVFPFRLQKIKQVTSVGIKTSEIARTNAIEIIIWVTIVIIMETI